MKLLEPHVGKGRPPRDTPYDDHVGDAVAQGTPAELREAIVKLVGERPVYGRAIDLVRYATDARPYRMVPQVVVTRGRSTMSWRSCAFVAKRGGTRRFARPAPA